MGFDIDAASINRHKNRHMLEHAEKIKENAHHKINRKFDRNDYTQIESIEMLNRALKLKPSVRKFKSLNDWIQKIFTNQITIVLNLQDKYMEGGTKYPHEEIRGLSIINEIVGKFESLISSMADILPLNIQNKGLTERANEINQAVIDGKITVEIGNKLLHGLATHAKIYEIDDLAQRVSELERIKNERTDG
jgi:glutamate synthase domain-containing protein 2